VSTTCNVLLAGVGGQGVLSMARLLGHAANEADLGVRVGQIYGLSQRGGSVEATVRIGPVNTAFISQNEADVVVGLEPLETERALPWMSEATTVLVNRTPIVPSSLTLDGNEYPDVESILGRIAAVSDVVHVMDGNALALEAGDPRLLNMVMLGAIARLELLTIPTEVLATTVERHGSGSERQSRASAFQLGHEYGLGTPADPSDFRDEPVNR